jgi:hypothetical protein
LRPLKGEHGTVDIEENDAVDQGGDRLDKLLRACPQIVTVIPVLYADPSTDRRLPRPLSQPGVPIAWARGYLNCAYLAAVVAISFRHRLGVAGGSEPRHAPACSLAPGRSGAPVFDGGRASSRLLAGSVLCVPWFLARVLLRWRSYERHPSVRGRARAGEILARFVRLAVR